MSAAVALSLILGFAFGVITTVVAMAWGQVCSMNDDDGDKIPPLTAPSERFSAWK